MATTDSAKSAAKKGADKVKSGAEKAKGKAGDAAGAVKKKKTGA